MDTTESSTLPKILINEQELEFTPNEPNGSTIHGDTADKRDSPPIGDNTPICDVVISGASCRLPESNNMEEFWQHLTNSTDMVTNDERRWKRGLYGLPERSGKLKDLVHFDADFFRMKPYQANAMDPQLRLLLEVTQEAIIDAGYNPTELRGSQTSVFVGSMDAEAYEASGSITAGQRAGHGFVGANDSMFPNSVSYYFDFKGPSVSVNTACSSSLTCLDMAAKTILTGQCQYALVAGVNILLKPGTSLHMLKLGVLSPDGACKSFDASGNGYVRSEGIAAVFLSAKDLSRRIYAYLLNTRSSHDGYKMQGITYPSGEAQEKLIFATQSEIDLNPNDVYYIEAHGTGTIAGDFEECKALDGIFSSPDREARKQPLLIGAVKSNMGHSEATSGLAQVIKVILSFRQGVIPPNLHLKVPNPRIMSIIENRFVVVTKPTPMPPNAIVGVSSFGLGGSTTHVILKGAGESKMKKIDGNFVEMETVTFSFPVSSRTESGLTHVMDFIEANRTNKELLTLISTSMSDTDSEVYPYRGYILWNDQECTRESSDMMESTTESSSEKPPVWFVFAGVGSQWSGMGKDLLQYPVFASTIQRCYDVLPSTVTNLVTSPVNTISNDTSSTSFVNQVVAICAVSFGVCELLKAVGIQPDYLIGHSLGELMVCYADGAMTMEQCMLVAYWRSVCIGEADIPLGAMAAVGLPWSEVATRCPKDVWLACNNAPDNVTISGRKEAVEKFTAVLDEEKVITRIVNSFDIASHSPLIQPAMGSKILDILKGIIPSPKPRSKKWIVTSVPEDKQENVVCSAEFHIQGTMSPVHFYEAVKKIPRNAVVLEIGPHALLHAPLKRSVQPGTTLIQLQNRKQKDQSVVFMNALGSCYNAGLSVNPLALLEPVKFPVGPKTPSIGHLMSWEHSEEWFVPKPEDFFSHSQASVKSIVTKITKIDPHSPTMFESMDLSDYKIDGDVAVPASFYLQLVWEALAESKDTTHSEISVAFQDVSFRKTLFLNHEKKTPLVLTTVISTLSGHFEISANDQDLLVTGSIESIKTDKTTATISRGVTQTERDGAIDVKSEDIYKEMSLKGYDLNDHFRVLLHSLDPSLHKCVLQPLSKLNGKPLAMMLEAPFQMCALHESETSEREVYSSVQLPTHLEYLEIHPQKMLSNEAEKHTTLHYDTKCGSCYTADGTMQLTNLEFSPKMRKLPHPEPCIESYKFQPYVQEDKDSIVSSTPELLRTMVDIVIENVSKKEVSVLQVMTDSTEKEVTLAAMLNDLVKAFFKTKIRHDVLCVGSKFDKSMPEITGNTFSVDTLELRSLPSEMPTYNLIVISNVGSRSSLPLMLNKLAPEGYLMVKESLSTYKDKLTDTSEKFISKDLESLNMHCVARQHFKSTKESNDESVILLYHHTPEKEMEGKADQFAFVHIQSSDRSLSWFSKLKKLLTEKDGPRRVYCISECDQDNPSGLVGMVNCLRLEGYARRLRCVYLIGMNWEEFQTKHSSTWLQILAADLMVNVVKDNRLGSFRHLPLKAAPSTEFVTQTNTLPPTLTEQPADAGTMSSTTPPFTCDSDKAFIITGGLGGFGLELANWLVARGATYLILTSRSGIRSGYQARKVEVMKSKGSVVEVSNLDVSIEGQAFELVKLALKKKPSCAIFHLAVVLKDSLFENQTEDSFKAVMAPKSTGAINLDKTLRSLSTLRPALRSSLFVSFSSGASGWGNPGQTNYGFANSTLERLSEQRVKDGLHGLAIQWGAIGDVGVAQRRLTGKNLETAATEVVIAHTKPQPIRSCLSSIDVMLNSPSPVISCCIPHLKYDDRITSQDTTEKGATTSRVTPDIKAKLCHILGVRNAAKVDMDAPLSQLGLDSLTAAEVQSLLKEFKITIGNEELLEISMGELVRRAGEDDATTNVALGIKTTICRILGIRNVDKLSSEKPLGEVGLDSLTASEVRSSLEEKYNLSIPTQDLTQMTIADLTKKTNAKDVRASVCRLLGIRNPQKVKMEDPLSELGLDSLTTSEVYDLLERDFSTTSISRSELPQMSLRSLTERVAAGGSSGVVKSVSTSSVDSGIVAVTSGELVTSV